MISFPISTKNAQLISSIQTPSEVPISDSSPLGNTPSDSSPYTPIALCKGTRSCVIKHPIQNFLLYHSLSPTYHASIFHISSEPIPTCVIDALSQPKWKAAMIDEMEALEKNGN